ncbi:hypothetical protein ACFLTB_03965 [Chloroflexota bacterium]
MKEVVIVTDAYPRIRNAMYIAMQNYHTYPVNILIHGNNDLLNFFKLANKKLFNNEINLIFFDYFLTDPIRVTAKGLKKIFYILPDMLREKRYLREVYKKYFSQFEGCEVYVLSRGYMDFYVAKKLRRKNRIVYISSYPTEVTPVQYTPASIIDIIKLIIAKLVYGGGITLGKLPHRKGFPHISDGFMKKEIDVVISDAERDEMMKDFILHKIKLFDVANYSVMYFPQSLMDSEYIGDKATYRREIVEIFGIISKYFPENEIASKYHPGYPESEKTIVRIGDILPDYIPAEFLYDDSIKMYLGAISSAISNVENGLVVSIMDLISLKSDEDRKALKQILVDMSHSEILFPKSLDELEEILIGIGQNKDIRVPDE